MNPGDQFCRVCGRQVTASSVPVASPAYAGPPETSSKAIVSLISGLFFFFFPFAVVAIIFGHLSFSEIRKSAGRLKGDGLAIAGLVLGYGGVAFIPIILIIAAIAIPNLLRARQAANQAVAVSSVRILVIAEKTYAQNHADAGYTCSLNDLSGSIDPSLAHGQKNGYTFELSDCDSDTGTIPFTKFRVVAYPVSINQSGRRAFCSDESEVVRVDQDGSARGCLTSGAPLQ